MLIGLRGLIIRGILGWTDGLTLGDGTSLTHRNIAKVLGRVAHLVHARAWVHIKLLLLSFRLVGKVCLVIRLSDQLVGSGRLVLTRSRLVIR